LIELLFGLTVSGCEKLGSLAKKWEMEKVRIVLEECGTEIDEEDVFQTLDNFTTFILLTEGQCWFPKPPVENIFAQLIEESRVSKGIHRIQQQCH
jgi:CIDE-N domain